MFGEGSGEWGGSEKGRFKKPVNPNGATSKDLKDATSYHRERQGKREFKGKSPLATSKGSTLVAREGLLKQLKKKDLNLVRGKTFFLNFYNKEKEVKE